MGTQEAHQATLKAQRDEQKRKRTPLIDTELSSPATKKPRRRTTRDDDDDDDDEQVAAIPGGGNTQKKDSKRSGPSTPRGSGKFKTEQGIQYDVWKPKMRTEGKGLPPGKAFSPELADHMPVLLDWPEGAQNAKLSDLKKAIPYNVRLADHLLYHFLKIFTNQELAKRFPADFTSQGKVRPARRRFGNPTLIRYKGQLFYIIYARHVALCGEHDPAKLEKLDNKSAASIALKDPSITSFGALPVPSNVESERCHIIERLTGDITEWKRKKQHRSSKVERDYEAPPDFDASPLEKYVWNKGLIDCYIPDLTVAHSDFVTKSANRSDEEEDNLSAASETYGHDYDASMPANDEIEDQVMGLSTTGDTLPEHLKMIDTTMRARQNSQNEETRRIAALIPFEYASNPEQTIESLMPPGYLTQALQWKVRKAKNHQLVSRDAINAELDGLKRTLTNIERHRSMQPILTLIQELAEETKRLYAENYKPEAKKHYAAAKLLWNSIFEEDLLAEGSQPYLKAFSEMYPRFVIPEMQEQQDPRQDDPDGDGHGDGHGDQDHLFSDYEDGVSDVTQGYDDLQEQTRPQQQEGKYSKKNNTGMALPPADNTQQAPLSYPAVVATGKVASPAGIPEPTRAMSRAAEQAKISKKAQTGADHENVTIARHESPQVSVTTSQKQVAWIPWTSATTQEKKLAAAQLKVEHGPEGPTMASISEAFETGNVYTRSKIEKLFPQAQWRLSCSYGFSGHCFWVPYDGNIPLFELTPEWPRLNASGGTWKPEDDLDAKFFTMIRVNITCEHSYGNNLYVKAPIINNEIGGQIRDFSQRFPDQVPIWWADENGAYTPVLNVLGRKSIPPSKAKFQQKFLKQPLTIQIPQKGSTNLGQDQQKGEAGGNATPQDSVPQQPCVKQAVAQTHEINNELAPKAPVNAVSQQAMQSLTIGATSDQTSRTRDTTSSHPQTALHNPGPINSARSQHEKADMTSACSGTSVAPVKKDGLVNKATDVSNTTVSSNDKIPASFHAHADVASSGAGSQEKASELLKVQSLPTEAAQGSSAEQQTSSSPVEAVRKESVQKTTQGRPPSMPIVKVVPPKLTRSKAVQEENEAASSAKRPDTRLARTSADAAVENNATAEAVSNTRRRSKTDSENLRRPATRSTTAKAKVDDDFPTSEED